MTRAARVRQEVARSSVGERLASMLWVMGKEVKATSAEPGQGGHGRSHTFGKAALHLLEPCARPGLKLCPLRNRHVLRTLHLVFQRGFVEEVGRGQPARAGALVGGEQSPVRLQ